MLGIESHNPVLAHFLRALDHPARQGAVQILQPPLREAQMPLLPVATPAFEPVPLPVGTTAFLFTDALEHNRQAAYNRAVAKNNLHNGVNDICALNVRQKTSKRLGCALKTPSRILSALFGNQDLV